MYVMCCICSKITLTLRPSRGCGIKFLRWGFRRVGQLPTTLFGGSWILEAVSGLSFLLLVIMNEWVRARNFQTFAFCPSCVNHLLPSLAYLPFLSDLALGTWRLHGLLLFSFTRAFVHLRCCNRASSLKHVLNGVQRQGI